MSMECLALNPAEGRGEGMGSGLVGQGSVLSFQTGKEQYLQVWKLQGGGSAIPPLLFIFWGISPGAEAVGRFLPAPRS